MSPHRLDLHVEAERGSLYPCPECGKTCQTHDFADKTWRHLNFFQHHCYLHARVPRTKCPEHGVKRIEVPWARPGSDFTLLFEQAAMSLVKEMPVLAVSLDETASRRGHRYITVFLDRQRKQEPVVFAVPGCGKDFIKAFSTFLATHGGDTNNVVEVDWFHIVQTFTRRLDEVRKKERREQEHPRSLRWALLKNLENENLTSKQLAALQALQALVADQSATADAWVIKEKCAGSRRP